MAKTGSTGFVWCYVTAKDARQAGRLASCLVEERLAACANILGPVRSIYRWKGRVCQDREAAVIFKTRRSLVARLARRVKELHSYECPCVVALPILGGHPPYLAWIAAETA